jgi:hypothetical protein
VWFREFKDYPIDKPLKKETLQPNRGFAGCEMHELNGWGSSYDLPKPVKKGFFQKLLEKIKA